MRKAIIVSSGFLALSQALDNGLGLSPPMGFNTFRAFGCNNYNETVILEQANLLVSLGLRDLGYNYMNIDDCWSLQTRDTNGHI